MSSQFSKATKFITWVASSLVFAISLAHLSAMIGIYETSKANTRAGTIKQSSVTFKAGRISA